MIECRDHHRRDSRPSCNLNSRYWKTRPCTWWWSAKHSMMTRTRIPRETFNHTLGEVQLDEIKASVRWVKLVRWHANTCISAFSVKKLVQLFFLKICFNALTFCRAERHCTVRTACWRMHEMIRCKWLSSPHYDFAVCTLFIGARIFAYVSGLGIQRRVVSPPNRARQTDSPRGYKKTWLTRTCWNRLSMTPSVDRCVQISRWRCLI